MTQRELVKCPHCESTSIFIHQEDDLCLCGECGEAWERATKAQIVPKWWRLVPVEPTKEMFAAGYDELENSESIELIYKRMISASPACGGSSEWVSVFKERPQKIEGNKIWATDGDTQFECEFNDGFWCNISGSEFTHWMPLPPAPVKDGE